MSESLNAYEPDPIKTNGRPVWELVIEGSIRQVRQCIGLVS